MPKSIVDPTKEVSETTWVVSVVNTDGAYEGLVGRGHAAIVVEGLRREPNSLRLTPFVNQYDILSATTNEEEDKKAQTGLNPKGRYTVRSFEGSECTRREGKDFYNKRPHKSYKVDDTTTVQQMIAAIKMEEAHCKRAERGERDAAGRLIELPLYQRVGTNHFLSETGMGENCASWCTNYLKMAVPEVAGTKSKPKYVAGTGMNCTVL